MHKKELFLICLTIAILSVASVPPYLASIHPVYAVSSYEQRLTPVVPGSDTIGNTLTYDGHTCATGFTTSISMDLPANTGVWIPTKIGFAVNGLGGTWYDNMGTTSVIYTPYVQEMSLTISGDSTSFSTQYNVDNIYDNAGDQTKPTTDFNQIITWLVNNILSLGKIPLSMPDITYSNPPSKQWIGPTNAPQCIDRQKMVFSLGWAGNVIDGTETQMATASLSSKFETHGLNTLTITAEAQIYAEGLWTSIYSGPGGIIVSHYVINSLVGTYSVSYTVKPLIDTPPGLPNFSGITTGDRNIASSYQVYADDPDTDIHQNPLDTVSYSIKWGDGAQQVYANNIPGNVITVTHVWNNVQTSLTQPFTILVQATDNWGLSSDILSYHVTITYNRPPTASNPVIVPVSSSNPYAFLHPCRLDTLWATYSYSDPNSDPQSGTKIVWYKNGVSQPGLNNYIALSPGTVRKGESWYFTVQPSDGIALGTAVASPAVTILDSPPSASNLYIIPTYPLNTQTLDGHYTFSDPDGDVTLNTQIRWYKGGVLQPAYNNWLYVPASALQTGQQWCFTVQPNDGTLLGPIIQSPTVTIGQLVQVTISIPQAPATGFDTDGSPRVPVSVYVDGIQYQIFSDKPAVVSINSVAPHTLQVDQGFLKEEWKPGYYYMYSFLQWSDGVTSNPRSFTANANTSISALYLRSKYAIT